MREEIVTLNAEVERVSIVRGKITLECSLWTEDRLDRNIEFSRNSLHPDIIHQAFVKAIEDGLSFRVRAKVLVREPGDES